MPYLTTVNNTCMHVAYILRSLSTIVTVALPGFTRITPSGSEDWSIVTVKCSFPSKVLSGVIPTSNGTLVTPAGNVTLYCPDP